MKKLGALWIRKSKDGKKFMSGNIVINDKTINLIVFTNDRKEKENHPDLNIFLSERKGENNQKKEWKKPEKKKEFLEGFGPGAEEDDQEDPDFQSSFNDEESED